MTEGESLSDIGERNPERAPRQGRGSRAIVAVGIPCVAWVALALPSVRFIWSALGHVGAQHAFFREVADYVVISIGFTLVGSIVVLPPAIWVLRSRRTVATVALTVASMLVFAGVHLMSIAWYSLRIT